MTIQLPEELERSIRAEVASGHFATEQEMVVEAVRSYLLQRVQGGSGQSDANGDSPDPARKPIWEKILEITADVPEEVWDGLPTDLAEQHDHYIYGTPKRPTA